MKEWEMAINSLLFHKYKSFEIMINVNDYRSTVHNPNNSNMCWVVSNLYKTMFFNWKTILSTKRTDHSWSVTLSQARMKKQLNHQRETEQLIIPTKITITAAHFWWCWTYRQSWPPYCMAHTLSLRKYWSICWCCHSCWCRSMIFWAEVFACVEIQSLVWGLF